MEAPGKGLLKAGSVLQIVFSSIATLFCLIGLIASSLVATIVASLFPGLEGLIGGIMVVVIIVFLAWYVVGILIGVMGLKRYDNPAKATFFIVWGIILGILGLIGVISNLRGGFSFGTVISIVIMLIVPVFFLVGGFQNKKAVQ